MDDSQPEAAAPFLRERSTFADAAPMPAALLDRDDLRLFTGAFVAGFLFFLIWFG
jgi:hypothetical protein